MKKMKLKRRAPESKKKVETDDVSVLAHLPATSIYSQTAYASGSNSTAKVRIINISEKFSERPVTQVSNNAAFFSQTAIATGPNSKAVVKIINYERKFLFNSAGDAKSSLYVFTEYQKTLNDFFSTQKISERVVYALIHGIAGSGKTTLVQLYLADFLKSDPGNRFVYLLNVETFSDYQNSLRGLAEALLGVEALKLTLDGLSSEQQQKAIVGVIKDGLSKRVWALVLDNLENDAAKILEDFEELFNSFSQGHVLITTQHDKTIKSTPFSLDLSAGLQTIDAKNLINKILDNLSREKRALLGSELELEALIKETDGLPLALALAGHYLWHENSIRLKITFASYLELLRKEVRTIEVEQSKRLEKKSDVPRDRKRKQFELVKTQHAAIRLSLRNAILLDEGESIDLIRILCFCGFLPSEHITMKILLDYGNTLSDSGDMGDVFFERVSAYSLLQSEKKESVVDKEPMRRMHRTVQKVLKQEFWPMLCSKLFAVPDAAFAASNEINMKLCRAMDEEMGRFAKVFVAIINATEEKDRHFVMRELIPQMREFLINYFSIFSESFSAQENGVSYAHFLHTLGNVYFKVGEFVSSKECLVQAEAIKRNIHQKNPIKENHLSLAKTLKVLGRVHSFIFKHQIQKECLEEALKIYERCLEKDDKKIGKMLGYLAAAYGYLGDYDTQLNLLLQAYGIIEAKSEKDSIDMAEISVRLGNAYAPKGNPEEQYRLLNMALPIYRKYYGETHPKVAMLLHFISFACRGIAEKNKRMESFVEAQKFIIESLGIMEELYGENSLQFAQVIVSLAHTHGELNDFSEMKRWLEYSLPIIGRCFGCSHPEYVKVEASLAEVNKKLGLWRKVDEFPDVSGNVAREKKQGL